MKTDVVEKGAENGKKFVAYRAADDADNQKEINFRLLDPAATPESLVETAFGIGVPMPTRTCTRDTAMALKALAIPMFGNVKHYSPDSLEVGEARNEIVRCALHDGVEWLFFMDYDVAPPPNALAKLLNLKTDISAGVYHLKQVPSYPLIYVKGWRYAFEDYEIGDLVKADGVGMGCTLINMSVFKNIDPPWFKTVPGISRDGNTILPYLTEDIYFCEKAQEAGYEIIVDTSVQAGHVDWRHGITYHLVTDSRDSRRPLPGWTYRRGEHYVTETLTRADHPGRKYAQTTPPEISEENPKLDLGSGANPHPGHMGVDPFVPGFVPNVRSEDMRDLSWYREEFGLAPAIHSCHSLEHLPYRDVPATLREWMSTLQPGGDITIYVPDGEMYLRSFVKRLDEGTDDSFEMTYIHNGLFGDEIHEGQVHQAIFTERSLMSLAMSVGIEDAKIERQGCDRVEGVVPETAQLCLTGKRGK